MERKDFFILIAMLNGAILMAILTVLLIYEGFLYINGNVDKTYCTVRINNKIVAKTYCHLIYVDSVGQNGNTKKVIIYKDKTQIKPIKQYLSNNVEIEGK